MKRLNKQFSPVIALAASILAVNSAMAANTFYAPGDLVLAFQKPGDTDTVYASLGNAATQFRGTAAGVAGATSSFNFLNINSALVSAFGSGWASDPGIYAGVSAAWSSENDNSALQDGDPSRTFYASKSRTAVGTVGLSSSTFGNVASDTGMSTISSGIETQNNILENFYTTAVAVSPTSVSNIDNQNLFLSPGVQGTAFGGIGGGVQQVGTVGTFGTFGDAGTVEFALDLYRFLSTATTPGQVAGVRRAGSYEGTITINTAGDVSFVNGIAPIPEPSGALALGLLGTVAGLGYRRRRA